MATTGERAAAPADLAADLLAAFRTGADPEALLCSLSELSEADLAPVRSDRATALAFWLNCYNAGTERLLAERPGLYESRWRFFRAPALSVADHPLGLDAIEHGILRGSRSKYGLGYLPRLLPDSFEHRYRLAAVDPRIHFALNCGAASCPAIRHYEPDRVDEQLDLATRSYLGSSVEYDAEAGVVRVPRVFLWYRGDFGGGSGIREFLAAYDAVPAGAEPRIRHRSWDWSPEPAKFE